MHKLYIWGAGNCFKTVYETIDKNNYIVVGIIDSDTKKQGKRWQDGLRIESPDILMHTEYDYIIVSVKKYQDIIKECSRMGICRDKIILFWKLDHSMPGIDPEKKRIVELEEKIEQLQREIELCKKRIENQPYEMGFGRQPDILPSEELLHVIMKKRASLCRFGDGEFEIMLGRERAWFQNINQELAARLKKIIYSEDDKILIAVADNFGSLAHYTETAADGIRRYLSGDTRQEVLALLDIRRTYYDAYVSRPYLMYRDKKHAGKIFDLFKEIWKKRSVLIVEGKYARTGVGNDLLSDAKKIRRILCPGVNAFAYHEEIFHEISRNTSRDDLILLTLGPTATVLAYDLAKHGLQALDIGQLDNEYDWYLRNANQRVEIPGKAVAELDWCHEPDDVQRDPNYEKQIIAQIT